jgi:hypothetical protein
MNALTHLEKNTMETCPNNLTGHRAGLARGMRDHRPGSALRLRYHRAGSALRLRYHRAGSALRLRQYRAASTRRPRRLLSRLGTIVIALVLATLMFIGGQWLLLDAPASGFELGVAVRASDAVAGD